MTATTSISTARTTLWHEVEKQFWVGNREGTFMGTIELSEQGVYLARDSAARVIGSLPSLQAARSAVDLRTE